MNDNEVRSPDIDKFAAIFGVIWPEATMYPPGARFRIRTDGDSLGYSIPNALRGRTGTVISVDGPVALGDLHRSADAKNLTRIGLNAAAHLIDVNVEMIHFVSYDDETDAPERLSHTWMEPESAPLRPDKSWLREPLQPR